jgi:hypothetical protein
MKYSNFSISLRMDPMTRELQKSKAAWHLLSYLSVAQHTDVAAMQREAL